MNTNNLTGIIVPISKGQRLSDLKEIYPLPSDAIFHKKLPGLGATHGEINAPRNSIIVLPNRPVIESKVAKHNSAEGRKKSEKIIGIYKGRSKDELIDYINDDTITYKKILITPEGYAEKLKKIPADKWEEVKKDYYLLIDECERAIQDKDFRNKISAPFDDFFEFQNKGLISATTLPFSDPRFDMLINYYIKPKYSYVQPLTLVGTNNIVAAFREYVEANPKEHYFIFLNSITAIVALIEALKIKETSKIHCSEKKRTALKNRKFHSSSTFDNTQLAKYNFFTSRYYSGFDLELPFKADVVMITEVVFAEHSILDPLTEVIQIVGRFRNGASSITHLTNFNSELECKNEAEVRVYLEGQRDVYKQIIKLKNELTNEGAKAAIAEILENTAFSRYFYKDGSYNYFMVDNYIQEQRVLGLYQSPENLLAAYKLVEDHFKLDVHTKTYPITDGDRLKRQSAEGRVAELKEVVYELKRLTPTLDHYVLGGEQLLSDLIDEYPIITKAFRVIGEEGIIACNYNEKKIKAKTEKATIEAKFHAPNVCKEVYAKFSVTPEGEKPPIYPHITTTLQEIFDRHGIKKFAEPSDIRRYFKARQTTTTVNGKKENAFRLLEVRDSLEPSR